jgi:hypothetical protein
MLPWRLTHQIYPAVPSMGDEGESVVVVGVDFFRAELPVDVSVAEAAVSLAWLATCWVALAAAAPAC